MHPNLRNYIVHMHQGQEQLLAYLFSVDPEAAAALPVVDDAPRDGLDEENSDGPAAHRP